MPIEAVSAGAGRRSVGVVNIGPACYAAGMATTTKTAAAARSYHHGDLRRALIDAGVAIVTEDQNWAFSLREVARRAGVSHNAPYNHFPEKKDLLDAVAGVGFERLRADMRAAMSETAEADGALDQIARAYVLFAADNPALYRLMFGPELVAADGSRPDSAAASGAGAKLVLREVVERGAREGRFSVASDDEASVAAIVLCVWSTVHGLAMLIIDGKSEQSTAPAELAGAVMAHLLDGIRER